MPAYREDHDNVDLPPQADAMYKQWWGLALDVGTSTDGEGNYLYTFADGQAAASEVNKTVYNGQGGYNPIGFSQLMSVARKIGNASGALNTAPDNSPITDAMVAEAPWSNSPSLMSAYPQWQARMNITYIDPQGVEQTGITTVVIPQTLPFSVGSLRAQMELRANDQLHDMSPNRTPRSGDLVSVDSITLLAI